MTKDTIKKSAPENEETVRNVFDTFNEEQILALCYIVGKAVKGDKTILDVINTLNDKQRLVFDYIVSKAVEDVKKGKTSKSLAPKFAYCPYCGTKIRKDTNETV